MLKILTVFTLLLSTTAFASGQGQQISPLIDEDGSPRLSVQISPSSKMVAITFSVLGRDLVGPLASSIMPAQWAIYDKSRGVAISAWSSLTNSGALIDPNSKTAFSVSVAQSDVVTVTESLNRALLVIAVKDGSQTPAPTQFIDLGGLCVSAPDRFMNLDTFTQGCN